VSKFFECVLIMLIPLMNKIYLLRGVRLEGLG